MLVTGTSPVAATAQDGGAPPQRCDTQKEKRASSAIVDAHGRLGLGLGLGLALALALGHVTGALAQEARKGFSMRTPPKLAPCCMSSLSTRWQPLTTAAWTIKAS